MLTIKVRFGQPVLSIILNTNLYSYYYSYLLVGVCSFITRKTVEMKVRSEEMKVTAVSCFSSLAKICFKSVFFYLLAKTEQS